jgi:hypothetical protein
LSPQGPTSLVFSLIECFLVINQRQWDSDDMKSAYCARTILCTLLATIHLTATVLSAQMEQEVLQDVCN